MAFPAGLAEHVAKRLQAHWWQSRPTLLMQILRPLSWLYRALASWQRMQTPARAAPVPVIVVGNIVVGGAGKTPTVIALVQALQEAGHRPGVLSRGHGRVGSEMREVAPDSAASLVGDEPLLIHRRTGVPVWVDRDRLAAAAALCAHHPEVNVLVCDDGLQHHALARVADVVVFDDRGVGNCLLLPAGPLRQPLPTTLPARTWVLYTGTQASTALPGGMAARSLGRLWPLADWWKGRAQGSRALAELHGQPVLAAAGLAAPEKFFAMLEAAGLSLQRLPQPDHASYDTLPWPAGQTQYILVTEKDAVKLQPGRPGNEHVGVVPLDFDLPPELVRGLLKLLPRHPSP